MNNKKLLIIFISGIVILLTSYMLRGKRSSSFDPQITMMDTTSIEKIQFIAGGADKPTFELKPVGKEWEATQGNIKVIVAHDAVKPILSTLADLKAKRIVTEDKAKYSEYEIDDAQAGEVMVWQGGKQVAHLFIGGFRFDQVARTASTYIRKGDQPEVYLVDGFAGLSLKTRFEQFRDKKLVKSAAEDLTSVDWTNASGIKQKIQKEDGAWYYAGMEAVDSTKFNNYLSTLVNAQGAEFSDLTSTQGLTLVEQLTLYGNNMAAPTTISAFHSQDTLAPFLIHSSANQEAIFTSDSTGLYKSVFLNLRQFWPDGQ
jgi:uncharacterized protein DUF4340